MQNFMVPVPLAGGGWHEAQIDELFASMLEKGFGDGGGAPAVEPGTGAEMLKGFRVFG